MSRLARELGRIGGTLLGWLAWVLLTLVWGLVVVPLTWLAMRVWPDARVRFADLTREALRLYVAGIPFARIHVEGAEKRLEGPRILVANHQSRLDTPVLLGLEPRLGGAVRGYMLRVPIIGSVIRLVGFFDADVPEAEVLESMRRAAEHARATDGALLFYPEGTRSKTGEIGPFRRGAFRAAVDHGLPIQPVVIEGLDTVLPPGHWITPVHGRYPVRIRYLEPLHPPYGDGIKRDVVRALCDRVRTRLVDELARMRAERESGR